ncbi:MAG: hypothetical protein PF481_04600 [Bacteroidales bacterium]|jgi:hypothetical protein|nr:hypothetical protein [Bacteroidales bacterium]
MIKNALIIVGVAVVMMTSCVVSQSYQLTGNPMGKKSGEASTNIFGTGDYSIKTAANKGNINKIGAVEITVKTYIFGFKTTTKVYGE